MFLLSDSYKRPAHTGKESCVSGTLDVKNKCIGLAHKMCRSEEGRKERVMLKKKMFACNIQVCNVFINSHLSFVDIIRKRNLLNIELPFSLSALLCEVKPEE